VKSCAWRGLFVLFLVVGGRRMMSVVYPVPGVVGMGHPVYDISRAPRPEISHKCMLFADEGKSEGDRSLLLRS
jgi:hypothetical protein